MISDLPAVFTGGPHNRKPLVTKKWVSLIFPYPQLSSYTQSKRINGSQERNNPGYTRA